MEVGPWRIDGQGGLKTVEGGWEEYTTMVYGSLILPWVQLPADYFLLPVDQPAGTGFSYTSTDKYVHGLTQVIPSLESSQDLVAHLHFQASEQFIEFLTTFYKIFPEYLSVDVSLSYHPRFVLLTGAVDLFGWRELCRAIHSVFR